MAWRSQLLGGQGVEAGSWVRGVQRLAGQDLGSDPGSEGFRWAEDRPLEGKESRRSLCAFQQ